MHSEFPERLRPWHQAVLVGAASLVLVLLSIKAWRLSLSVPFEFHWDSLYSQMQVKDILDHGWTLTNSSLGAPFGGQGYDYPEGDSNLNFLVMKLLGIATHDSASVLNLFWLLTFPATAVAAWGVARSLGIPSWPAMFCGVVFSLLPYHFWRGEAHLLLSAYYSVPLGCYLVLRALGEEPLFERRRGSPGRIRQWLSRRSAGTIAICVVLGSAGVYYAVFTILLLISAALLTLRRRSELAPLGAFVAVGLIVATLAANFSPSLLYQAAHGTNPVAAERTPADSEYESLTLTALLLPADHHRIGAFADAKANYSASTIATSEGAQSLGLIASVGFLWLLFLLAASALGRRVASATPVERRAAVANGLAFLIGTVGGVSSLIAYGISPQIRGWNRISIFIGFFALLAVASLLARAPRPFERFRWGAAAPASLLACLLAVAVYDQAAPARFGQFDPAYLEPQNHSDGEFVAELERVLPDGAAVFQLPYLAFPEGYPPPGRMADYDPLRGFLHSEDLRWSYGATKNRSADLSACLVGFSPRRLLPVLVAAGFEAVWIDRFGYAAARDRRLEASMAALVPGRAIVSPDRRFVAFPLRGFEVDPTRLARLGRALPRDADELIDCGRTRKHLEVALG